VAGDAFVPSQAGDHLAARVAENLLEVQVALFDRSPFAHGYGILVPRALRMALRRRRVAASSSTHSPPRSDTAAP
jgi:hypothetical protein